MDKSLGPAVLATKPTNTESSGNNVISQVLHSNFFCERLVAAVAFKICLMEIIILGTKLVDNNNLLLSGFNLIHSI